MQRSQAYLCRFADKWQLFVPLHSLLSQVWTVRSVLIMSLADRGATWVSIVVLVEVPLSTQPFSLLLCLIPLQHYLGGSMLWDDGHAPTCAVDSIGIQRKARVTATHKGARCVGAGMLTIVCPICALINVCRMGNGIPDMYMSTYSEWALVANSRAMHVLDNSLVEVSTRTTSQSELYGIYTDKKAAYRKAVIGRIQYCNDREWTYIHTYIHTYVPVQFCPLPSSTKPSMQPHTKEPGVFMQFCWQLCVPFVHSSMSVGWAMGYIVNGHCWPTEELCFFGMNVYIEDCITVSRQMWKQTVFYRQCTASKRN